MMKTGTLAVKTVDQLLHSVRYGHRNHGVECERCALNADALEAYIRMLERELSRRNYAGDANK